ncbi:MAG TPA: hypothetical protein VFF37_17150 [Streptomyces sp.]|nr:hypothetical protein [Streptomyces sp.]
MAEETPVVVHPLSPEVGRLVTIRGERVGVAYHLFDLLEFLRRAGLPEADMAIDDAELIEWRGGGPDVWAEPPP